jgi:hypothetical protein
MGARGRADTSRMDTPPELAPAAQLPGAEAPTPAAHPRRGVRRVRLGAAIAVALAVGLGAWLILRGGGQSPAQDGPVSSAVSVGQLRALPDQTGHQVYWAGPFGDHTYELTRPTDGNVYVRYLPPGVSVGDGRPDYTTVGTYPRPLALKGLRRLGRQPDAVTFPVPDGGLGVYGRDRPTSVYLAFPGEDVQVEVYDPSPRKARRLARSGRVRPIG